MKILPILILALFGVGMFMLSRYAQHSMEDAQKYGTTNSLIMSIRKHVEDNPKGNLQSPQLSTSSKQIIQYGGGVEVQTEVSGTPHTTYYGSASDDVPKTNEGQPGQPVPLTRTPPMNPIYR